MSVWTGRSQPSLDVGVAARSAARRRTVPSGRVFAVLALACLALGVLVDGGRAERVGRLRLSRALTLRLGLGC
jgi:hypothetical protein